MSIDLLERFDAADVGGVVRGVLTALIPADEVPAVAREVREAFAGLSGEIPYADRPRHSMFLSAFGVFVYLALYQVLSARGLDVHRIGRAMLAAPMIDIVPDAEQIAPDRRRVRGVDERRPRARGSSRSSWSAAAARSTSG